MSQLAIKQDFSNPKGIRLIVNNAIKHIRPPEKLTPSQWAEANIRIPIGNAIPGYIRFDNAPYQREPLDMMANPECQRITLMWGAQTGKALDVNTLIPTPDGFKPMSEVDVGDVVFDENGKQCSVTFTTEHHYNRKCYEVEFSDGSSIIADADHLWAVDDKGYKLRGVLKPRKLIATTEDLIDGTYRARKQGRTRYSIDVIANPISISDSDLKVDPYVVGAWLGDGDKKLSQIIVTRKDTELTDVISKLGYQTKTRYRDKRNANTGYVSISLPDGTPLITALKREEITKDHIPSKYMFGSYEQRLSLLQGLLDTDGYADNKGRVEFINKRENISSLVYILASSIGLKPIKKKVFKSCIYKDIKKEGIYHQVTFKAYQGEMLFRLARKQKVIDSIEKDIRLFDSRARRIKNIKEVPTRPVKCIQVDSPNHLYLVGESMIATHNTQLVNCGIGYYIEHEPSSQIMMQPSQGDLHTWLETKFNPMVDANDGLQERIAKPRGREGVNNQKMKSYIGGFLMFAWSGSPKTMRGRSAPKIYCDEVDGYEPTPEGHQVFLLWQRAATFGDQRMLLVTSTPTIKGASTVEDSFLQGDQRYYHIPCPHCGTYQKLEWKNVQWVSDDDGHHPETAGYFCCDCGSMITDTEKRAALRKGKWIAEKPFDGHASYHLSELYSAFRKWSDIARSFLEKKAANDLQTFVNVSLAETWEETGEQADPNALITFAENFDKDSLDTPILFLTAGVDIQKDRIEVQVVGWDEQERPYVICHDMLFGDTNRQAVWDDLDHYLVQPFCGLKIAICYIDSGYNTEIVYKFTKPRHGRFIFPVKGESGQKDAVSRPKQTAAQRVMLVKVGIDGIKRRMLEFLKEPGELIHFSYVLNEEFYAQLTAEKMIIKKVRGFQRIEFHKTRQRNEALDCFVYAYAAMVGLRPDIGRIKKNREPKPQPEPPPAPTPGKTPIKRTIRPKRPGFAKRY